MKEEEIHTEISRKSCFLWLKTRGRESIRI